MKKGLFELLPDVLPYALFVLLALLVFFVFLPFVGREVAVLREMANPIVINATMG